MTSHPCLQLVAYKQWADRSLYELARGVLERMDAADAAILMQILDHMHAVDRIFQHHLRGVPHTFQAPRSRQMPDFDRLDDSVRDTDEWYVAHVRTLTDGDLAQPVDFTFTSGKPARMERGEILLHVCLHGQYHRGNAGALLQLRGFTLVRDGFTDYLEQRRGPPLPLIAA